MRLAREVFAAAMVVAVSAAGAYDNIWMHLHHGGLHSDKDLLFVSNAIVRAAKAGISDRRAMFAHPSIPTRIICTPVQRQGCGPVC